MFRKASIVAALSAGLLMSNCAGLTPTTVSSVTSAFIAEVGRIEAFLEETPSLYQLVEDGVRRATLRRFPYGLFYLEEADRVLILACVDLRRDPQTIARLVRG